MSAEYWPTSVYVPDADRVEDRIKCRQYDETCNCPACVDDREKQKDSSK